MPDRISVDFGSLSNGELWERGGAVVLALTGSVKYSNPPVTMAILKSLLDNFQGAIADTLGGQQGSKMAMATRDALRAQVISALRQVANYVQENSGGDLSGTGFETYDNKRKPPQPVTTPTFRKIYRGPNSGEIMFLINAVPNARGYEVQYAALQDGVSGPWTAVDVMNVKSAFKISGLTPATRYVFQVRAIGVINKSDWSDSVTIMCV